MSWFVSVGPVDSRDFPSALEAASPSGQSAQEVQEQVELAKKATLDIFAAFGKDVPSGFTVGCSLSGHAVTNKLLLADQTAAIAIQVYQSRACAAEPKTRPVVTGGLSTSEAETPTPEPPEDEPAPESETRHPEVATAT